MSTVRQRNEAYLISGTPQEVFDKMARGLAGQGFTKSVERSPSGVETLHCKYRGPCGLRCAVGHLVEDEATARAMDVEGNVASAEGKHLIRFEDQSVRGVVQSAQRAHDRAYVGPLQVYAQLREVAAHYELDASALGAAPL